MKWLNAFGFVLQFVSFWLVAPEILGEKTLIRISGGLKKFISNLSVIILILAFTSYGLFFSVMGIMKGLDSTRNGISSDGLNAYYVKIGIAMALYFIVMIFYKKIRNWLDTRISGPIIEKFIRNEDMRKNSLLTGAVLFTTGFLIQLIIIIIQ